VACEGRNFVARKGIRWMRVQHEFTPVFDDPNLVSCAGLAPVLTLADRAGLMELVGRHLTLQGEGAARDHRPTGQLPPRLSARTSPRRC
jgi:hypothetical protein